MNDYYFIRVPRCASNSMQKTLGLHIDHTTPEMVVEKYGAKSWNESFTFAFVRNPWERLVSWYFFHQRTKNPLHSMYGAEFPTFRSWAKAKFPHHWHHWPFDPLSQATWLSSQSQLTIDFVGRFERIQDDWEHVCSVLGREPKLGNQARSSHKDYRTYYDDELVEIAATKYREDIELLGYTFE